MINWSGLMYFESKQYIKELFYEIEASKVV